MSLGILGLNEDFVQMNEIMGLLAIIFSLSLVENLTLLNRKFYILHHYIKDLVFDENITHYTRTS